MGCFEFAAFAAYGHCAFSDWLKLVLCWQFWNGTISYFWGKSELKIAQISKTLQFWYTQNHQIKSFTQQTLDKFEILPFSNRNCHFCNKTPQKFWDRSRLDLWFAAFCVEKSSYRFQKKKQIFPWKWLLSKSSSLQWYCLPLWSHVKPMWKTHEF